MTYFQFHLIFILPPILLLLWGIARHDRTSAHERRLKRWPLAAIVVIALAYTTPWDNYLVREGIWSYGEDRVVGTIGYVPVEEYLFFALQPLLTGLWLCLVLIRWRRHSPASGRARSGMIPGAAWVLVALLGVWLLRADDTRYLGLILVWACPVLAGQWFYGGRCYRPLIGTLGVAVTAPTIYLWVVDRVAIGAGIWSISRRYTTGVHLLGLPIEEAIFFLLTNLLVAQGLLLFLLPLPRLARSGEALPSVS